MELRVNILKAMSLSSLQLTQYTLQRARAKGVTDIDLLISHIDSTIREEHNRRQSKVKRSLYVRNTPPAPHKPPKYCPHCKDSPMWPAIVGEGDDVNVIACKKCRYSEVV